MKKLMAVLLIAILAFSLILPVSAAEGDDDDVLYQRILKPLKIDKAPNLELIDESWGDPLIYVVESMPDAKLVTYWNGMVYPQYNNPDILPESCEFYFYCRWDAKYLYIGVKSPDTEPCGWVEPWCGDGVQMWIKHRNGVEDPYEHYYQKMSTMYWTLAFDDYSVDTGDLAKDLDCYITFDEEYMHATIAIPFTEIGIGKKEVADGLPLALVLMRISSRTPEDMGYAGWMNWGFDYIITLVLDDPEVEDKPLETIPTTAKPPVYDTDPKDEDPDDTGAETDPPEETEPAVIDPVETDPPATEAPATEAPATEAPATEAPATEAPATEAPATEAPATEAPATEAPATEAPATEAPATEAPATEAPKVEEPATEAPKVEEPATEAPKIEEPAEKNNTGLIIAIVAVVVVVGAGLGIVLGKKKK